MIKMLFICLFFLTLAKSQNLVLNPSLEESSKSFPDHWEPINLTPDIYRKGEPDNSFHDNMISFNFGNCFFGLMNSKNWSEIIQAELTTPLQSNKIYQIKIQASKYQFCPSGFNNVEVILTKASLPKSSSDKMKYKYLFTKLYSDGMDTLKSRAKWLEFSGYYEAKGDEKFISIGRFSVYFEEDHVIRQAEKNGVVYSDKITSGCTYIYFDSLIVTEYKVPYNKPIVLNNVFFETNKSTLLPESFLSLDNIYLILSNNQNTKIKISGYTDNIGNSNKNQKLSSERALSVQNYLINKGINKSRITSYGFGDKNPIGNNNTKEGRDKNRRVEMEYLEFN